MMETNAALARLELSRERLRSQLQAQGKVSRAGDSRSPGLAVAAGPWPQRWLDGMGNVRSTAMLAADAASFALLPVAQAHPIRLVSGAFIFGAVLVWSRPWSWLFKPAWFAGVVPQLLARVMATSLPPPVHSGS